MIAWTTTIRIDATGLFVKLKAKTGKGLADSGSQLPQTGIRGELPCRIKSAPARVTHIDQFEKIGDGLFRMG